MKIVADENIPAIADYFGSCGELLLKPGRMITRADLLDADILLVRSITCVDEALLHDTTIKFVGSATAGADHLDKEWLDKAGICWSVATGNNAEAVAQYVVCVVAALQKQGLLVGPKLRAAVIGVGNVGCLIVDKLKALDFEVLQYDPLRAENETDFVSTSWDQLDNLDLISVHTPLTLTGQYPSYHLIEKNFLMRQKPGCVLLNAGRGAVVAFDDLRQYGKHLHWCLDVWEYEPKINSEILTAALIATPHIAGYSEQAKLRGIQMMYQAAVKYGFVSALANDHGLSQVEDLLTNKNNWQDIVLDVYDPRLTSQLMKTMLLNQPEYFDHLRKNFPLRHEFSTFSIADTVLSQDQKAILRKLGFR